MENLLELALIVNRIKTRRIEIIGKERTKYGKLTKKLYDGIIEGKYKTDQEAAIDIYGLDFKPTNFARLKNILSNKLINTLFFIDISDYNFNGFQKAYINCEKHRSAIKILLARSARNSAIKLAERIIKKSIKFGFTDVTLELARILRRHYRTHSTQPDKETFYQKITNDYYRLLGAEIEMENYYELIIKETRILKKAKKEVLASLKGLEKKVHALTCDTQSYKLDQFRFFSLIAIHEFTRNYVAVTEVCNSAIAYFEKNKEIYSNIIAYQFYNKLLAVCVPLKRFEKGEEIAEKILPDLDNGSINWYLTIDYLFLLSLHTNNYDKAVFLYKKATRNKRFRNLTKDFQELWRVYEAYLEYLRAVGKLPIASEPFKINKFMNEVPIFSKDKKGINIAIIIIQILFLVLQGKEGKVIDKVEPLRVYAHTHLRKDDSFRSNCFIKMILGMVKANFHKNGTIRQTKDFYQKLVNTPIIEKSQSQYVEIIPYEQLWDMALSQLSNRAF